MADVRATTATPIANDFGVGIASSNLGSPLVVNRTNGSAYVMTTAGSIVQIAGQVAQLFVKRAADMQSTADQIFTKSFAGTRYQIVDVMAHCVSGGANAPCAGGVYTAAAKGGTPLVAAGQSWLALSAVNKLLSATLEAVVGTDSQSATPYLSLTSGSTAAATADLFIWGYILD